MAVPGMKSTLSVASPDKAAQIRSAVTGALKKDESGLPCFENTVETTFVLPWDLNPNVEPEKLTVPVRDEIRTDLMDQVMLQHLEGCGCINWSNLVVWQLCPLVGGVATTNADGSEAWIDAGSLSAILEMGYLSSRKEDKFNVGVATYHVDYQQRHLLNTYTHDLCQTRRLAFTPLMPMKAETGVCSLFHACSLAFWGVHDRTSLLREAVQFCMVDMKTQFLFYSRWSQQLQQDKEFPHWEAAKKDPVKAAKLHVFAMANIIQRPVIVYAKQGCDIGGVYLPLLWKDTHTTFPCAKHRHLRNPIALGYASATPHFAPLVTFKGPKGPQPMLLPLAYSSGDPFPVHYLTPAEKTGDCLSILSEAMFVDLVPLQTTPPGHSPSGHQTLVAISSATELPEVMDSLIKRYQSLFL